MTPSWANLWNPSWGKEYPKRLFTTSSSAGGWSRRLPDHCLPRLPGMHCSNSANLTLVYMPWYSLCLPLYQCHPVLPSVWGVGNTRSTRNVDSFSYFDVCRVNLLIWGLECWKEVDAGQLLLTAFIVVCSEGEHKGGGMIKICHFVLFWVGRRAVATCRF